MSLLVLGIQGVSVRSAGSVGKMEDVRRLACCWARSLLTIFEHNITSDIRHQTFAARCIAALRYLKVLIACEVFERNSTTSLPASSTSTFVFEHTTHTHTHELKPFGQVLLYCRLRTSCGTAVEFERDSGRWS